jgi:hypothetical protein
MLTLYTVSALFFESPVLDNLKKLVIFEDLNETYISANITGRQHELLEAEPIRVPSMQVAEALAEASLGLQYLSAAFIIDAGEFWEVCQSDWVWEQLRTLSLTSYDLVPHKEATDLNRVLHSAAQAVKKMPRLRIMEL